jgi:Uma2 family endonuclease
MQTTVSAPPKTLLEVYRMLPEGTRAELINGILYMSPAPTLGHQDVIFALIGQFYNFTNNKKKAAFSFLP